MNLTVRGFPLYLGLVLKTMGLTATWTEGCVTGFPYFPMQVAGLTFIAAQVEFYVTCGGGELK